MTHRSWIRHPDYPAKYDREWVVWMQLGPARVLGFGFDGEHRVIDGYPGKRLVEDICRSKNWVEVKP